VDETLDTRLQLHEGAVVGDVGHAAGPCTDSERVLGRDQIPRIFLQLLHAEADAVGFLVDLDDLHLHGLADRRISEGWLTRRQAMSVTCSRPSTPPRSTKAPYSVMFLTTPSTVALGELADDLGALFGAAFFEDRAARDDDVAAAAVHLEDLEGLLEAHQRAGVAHRAHIDLGAGQEGHGAAEIDGEAALDPTEDRAFDAGIVGIGLFQRSQASSRRAMSRLMTASPRAFSAVEEHLDLVTDGDVGRSPGFANSLRSTRPSIL
jgi:hypothetical protein